MPPSQNSGLLKMLGVMASIATIVAACIALIALIPAFGQWFFPNPPISSTATTSPQTPGEINVSIEPPTRSNPTETAVPTPGSTQPGTVLEVGQAWRQGGLELRLTGTGVWPKTILAYFTLTNTDNVQRVIEYSQDNFSSVDNLGGRIDTGGIYWNGDPSVQHTCSSRTVILEPNDHDSILFRCDWGNFEGLALAVSVADIDITGIIITVSGISSIDNARWRIPIHH